MLIQIENQSHRITVDNVETIIFHTMDGDQAFNSPIFMDLPIDYISFSIVKPNSVASYDNSHRIATAIQ